jgi:hypothetical protein
VVNEELGEYLGPPYTLAQGTDPLGNEYVVKAREYEGGLAVVRNRGDWYQGIEPETAVPVTLPTALFSLDPDGMTGEATSTVYLRNGQGAVLLNSPVPVKLLSFTAERAGDQAVLAWEVGGESSDHLGFHVHREDANGERVRLTSTFLSGNRSYTYIDTDPPAHDARYWLAEFTRDGSTTWYGPAAISPRVPGQGSFFLAQNQPNPVRGETIIRFGVEVEGPVSLRIFDVRGREVARLYEGPADPGAQEVAWDGTNTQGTRVPPGVYFYRLETPLGTRARKLLLTN